MTPIVFAFDNRLAMPAAVCIYSLLVNALPSTRYHIIILHGGHDKLDTTYIDKVIAQFPQTKIDYRSVGDAFKSAFEIRGITIPAYYRLLIPSLIPEYDRVVYSDVDVIFRNDLSALCRQTPLDNSYIAALSNMAFLDKNMHRHYRNKLGLDPTKVIASGFLIFNCPLIRSNGLEQQFKELARNKYKYQDQDVLNLSCVDHISYLPPVVNVATYFAEAAAKNPRALRQIYTEAEISAALTHGNIHYNGRKPWQGPCINFDIWWEYYRRSPIFDPVFYFNFFNRQLNLLDSLPLWKRVKVLARYFLHGRYRD